MSKGWDYSSGDWNAVCDSCGKKVKASELKKRWDGFMVCEDDWNPRQSLDFVRARQDKIAVEWQRVPPLPPENFVTFQRSDGTIGASQPFWSGESFLPSAASFVDRLTSIPEDLSYSGTFYRSISESFNTFSESLSFAKSKGITESFNTFSDDLSYVATWNRSIADSSTPSDVLNYVHYTPLLNSAPLNTLPLG